MTKTKRHEHDFYPTDEALTRLLIRHQKIKGTILEPCSGDGDIARVFTGFGNTVITNDLHNEKASRHYDASLGGFYRYLACHHYEWIITNPPYGKEVLPLIVGNALATGCNVAMMLRLSFLEPCGDRAYLLNKYPLTKLIIYNPRPKWRTDKKGSDSVTNAWFIWEQIRSRADELPSESTDIIYDNTWRELP